MACTLQGDVVVVCWVASVLLLVRGVFSHTVFGVHGMFLLVEVELVKL